MSDKKDIKVYIADESHVNIGDLDRFFPSDYKASITKVINQANIVLFTGGADVSPQFYKQTPIKATHSYPSRDIKEFKAFKNAQFFKIPMIGICRGAQFLCVMSGGSLIQDVNNHTGKHSIKLAYDPIEGHDEVNIEVTSTHHQMMDLRNVDPKEYMLLGYSISRSSKYICENEKDHLEELREWSENSQQSGCLQENTDIIEPEMVYFSNTDALCMQFHPEYFDFSRLKADTNKASAEYIRAFIEDFVNIKK